MVTQLKQWLHFVSDTGSAFLLLYALLIERQYGLYFLILVALVVGIKVIADLLN